MKKSEFQELVTECVGDSLNILEAGDLDCWNFIVSNNLPWGVLGHTDIENKKILINKKFVKYGKVVEIKKVILHEIAHVYAGGGHGEKFQTYASKLGGFEEGHTHISVAEYKLNSFKQNYPYLLLDILLVIVLLSFIELTFWLLMK